MLLLPASALRPALLLLLGPTPTTREGGQVLRPRRRCKGAHLQWFLLDYGPHQPETSKRELAQQCSALASFRLSTGNMGRRQRFQMAVGYLRFTPLALADRVHCR